MCATLRTSPSTLVFRNTVTSARLAKRFIWAGNAQLSDVLDASCALILPTTRIRFPIGDSARSPCWKAAKSWYRERLPQSGLSTTQALVVCQCRLDDGGITHCTFRCCIWQAHVVTQLPGMHVQCCREKGHCLDPAKEITMIAQIQAPSVFAAMPRRRRRLCSNGLARFLDRLTPVS